MAMLILVNGHGHTRSKSYSSTVGNCMENETWTIPKRELKLNVKLSENELN